MDTAGFVLKDGRQPAFRGIEQKRFIRLSSLGEGYSEEELRAVISGKSIHKAKGGSRQVHEQKKFQMLIDIQAKMAAEKRMVEIGALQTHINNYSKTRKVYEAYRHSGYSKKFFEEHREEIALHKAAKQAFDQLEGKKIPSRQVLHEEFNRLLLQKKQDYAALFCFCRDVV